jgi:hypothetical protein
MSLHVITDTAFCRNPCTKKWYKYDDEQVYDMSESDVKVRYDMSESDVKVRYDMSGIKVRYDMSDVKVRYDRCMTCQMTR